MAVKREREFELSSTTIETLNVSKVDEGARVSMRVHESWWSNESESLNFHSTLFEILNMFKVDESTRQSMRVHKSWYLNKSESLNSHQLSSKF